MGFFSNPLKKHKKIAKNTVAGKLGSKSIVGRQLTGGNSSSQPAQRSGAKPMQVAPGAAPGGGVKPRMSTGGPGQPTPYGGMPRDLEARPRGPDVMGAPRRAEGGMVGKGKGGKGCGHKGRK